MFSRVVWLIIILFAYREVASIIFPGLHDKLQIVKVIYAILNLFSICCCVSVCTSFCVCPCLQVYAYSWVCFKKKSTLFFFSKCVIMEMYVSAVSWEDFCYTVAPSQHLNSSSPGGQRPGIRGNRTRWAHKSLPWRQRLNSDFITPRHFFFLSCHLADGVVQQQSLVVDMFWQQTMAQQTTQNCQSYSASV